MDPQLRTIIYPVKDLDAAKQAFTALLGVPPVMDAPYYVQFDVGGTEIGLDPNGEAKGLTGPVPYWHVADLDATTAALLEAGATPDQPVADYGGRRVSTVRDRDGNPVGLIQES